MVSSNGLPSDNIWTLKTNVNLRYLIGFLTNFQGDSVDVCFTCIDRATGVVLKAPQEGKITIACKENNEGVDISSSTCEFF